MTGPSPLEPHVADLPGGPLAYGLRRSARSRGVRVTIHPDLGVVVAVPPPERRGWRNPDRVVEAFLREREPWIRRHVARQEARHRDAAAAAASGRIRFLGEWHTVQLGSPTDVTSVERVGGPSGDVLLIRRGRRERRTPAGILDRWFRARAAAAIEAAIAVHAGPLGARPAQVVLRDPRSRWGSASRAGRLMFSWRLILAPPAALETVVVHELAHLRVFGHGPAFWDLVAARRPDHARWRRWLRVHAHELRGQPDAQAEG